MLHHLFHVCVKEHGCHKFDSRFLEALQRPPAWPIDRGKLVRFMADLAGDTSGYPVQWQRGDWSLVCEMLPGTSQAAAEHGLQTYELARAGVMPKTSWQSCAGALDGKGRMPNSRLDFHMYLDLGLAGK